MRKLISFVMFITTLAITSFALAQVEHKIRGQISYKNKPASDALVTLGCVDEPVRTDGYGAFRATTSGGGKCTIVVTYKERKSESVDFELSGTTTRVFVTLRWSADTWLLDVRN